MIYKYLHKLFIPHVFAFEGEFAHKYSLFFEGRTENSDEKTQLAYNQKERVLVSSEQRPTTLIWDRRHKCSFCINPNRFFTGQIILCFYICNKSLITDNMSFLSVINDLLLYIQIHYSYKNIHFTFSVL